ncbi:Uncharacterised protein [Vibrio cholerae]|nr:Uncharacterised protein [Vibrio cholerae]
MKSSHSPLSVTRRSACSTVMPLPRAQPSAALVGLPSASNATLTAGPRFSTTRSGWLSAKLATFSAKRRGVANQVTPSWAMSAVASSAAKFAAKASASVRSCFGGSSSVPSSIKNSFAM